MNKIKENYKKISAFILAFLLSFIAIVPGIKAETGTSSWIPGYFYSVAGGTHGQMDRLQIDGEDVFCIDPERVFKNGSGFSEGNIKEVVSEENLKKIEFIHHYGYILNGKGDRNRAFTQIAIWETLGYSVKVGSSNGSNDRRGDYESWLSSVKAKINTFNSVPSWNGTTIKGKIGDIIALDGENKINGSHVVDSAGSSVWAEDGKIKIKITENSQNKKIILKKLPQGYDESNGVTLLYKKSGSQKVGKITTAPDPKYFNVNLQVENPTQAKILKLGENGEKVKGAIFEMCYSEDFKSSTVYEYTTDENGFTKLDDWALQGKTVYVREKFVPAPYIKSDEIKTFKVTNGGNVELKFVNKKSKGEIRILKADNTTGKGLAGAEFELYKNSVDKSNLIGKFATKNDGKLSIDSLELGKYILREIKAPEGYFIDNNNRDTEFNLEYKNQTVEKVVVEKKITNEKITTEVELTKKDTMNLKNVPGATVEFENVKTKEKKTAVTDADGKIKITLTYGEWIYKETIAPVGYVKAEKYGKINVTENGAKIQEVLWNQPITSDYILTKQDTISKKALPNCEVKIVNAETGEEVFKGKTDENGKITIKLRYGKYILEETIAPVGYVKATKTLEINVTEDGAEIQQVLYNDKIQQMPKTNLYSSSMIFSALLLVSGLGAGFVLLKIKKQEEN
ncbi:SpaA isopeptide-forming pilin-related protein [Parvimonas micra]|uniref:SpaA isopeptide-forming pilin-related protein n=1 Tax=Parvimonas micra TaxID=33033 RepID=UPI0028E83F25|nr:SpaA isopeptide-forming pilin-related protein [Parvimonas micra]